jgi:serine/threonine protein kinase/tetratricopeptide (TPR) repeat protein
MTEESLFDEALSKPPAERAKFLDAACAGQPELRAAVEGLLAAHEASGNVLDRPVATGEFTPPPAERTASTTDYQPDFEPGAVIAGRYTLVEKIGEGGMGEVWVAKQTEPVKRKVALKLIKAGMDSKAVLQRFEQERQALALMDHPNIAKVLDGGMSDGSRSGLASFNDREGSGLASSGEETKRAASSTAGRPFFVMELVHGLPLTKFCDEAKLGIRERLELFTPICQAVQHAHQKGIIHRDLKPSNILVTIIDGKGISKVIDFGVAKATSGRLTDESLSTQFGAVVGTLEYMAPEQAGYAGADIDTRADIYSLGVILYELLTGLRPLDAARLRKAALTEMVRIIKEEEPSKPSTRLSSDASAPSLAALRHTQPRKLAALLRGELDWVVMKCLEKQRDRRYETANGLGRDIQRYLADEPVEARPPSAGYRLQKFVRRNKGRVIAASLVLVALLVGFAGTTWGLIEARRQEQIALKEAAAKEKARAAEAEQRQLAEANEQKARASAEAEKKSKEEAQAREGETKAVLDFVENKVFAAARPTDQAGGQGYDVKLADAIKAALPFVDKSFTAQPLIEARLRRTMGISFFYLGDAKTAAAQFKAALQLHTQHRGPNHPDTLRSMGNLANSYEAAGWIQEALKLREETLQLVRAKLGSDDPQKLESMHNLANSYLAAHRTQEALKLFEESLQLQKAKLGPDHPSTLLIMNNLARCYLAGGRTQEAIKLHEETLQLQKAKLGPDHPETLMSMSNLAISYAEAGRPREAIKLHEETLQLQKAKLGPDHPDTLGSMNNLANAYAAAGRTQEALNLHEETLRLKKAKLGPDHPATLVTMSNLAGCLASFPDVKLRDPQRAVDVAARAVAGDPKNADFRDTLGTARYRAGDWKGAIADLEHAIRLRKPDDPECSSAGFFLAMAYWQVGDRAKARAWSDKAVAWMEQGTQKDDADLKRFRAEAAELLGIKEKR